MEVGGEVKAAHSQLALFGEGSITANILRFQDTDGEHLLPKIRDSAGQKGTGKWTAISALEYGVPVTLIGNTQLWIEPFHLTVLTLVSFWPLRVTRSLRESLQP